MRKILIVGCGYLGVRVASSWIKQGGEVYALTRSATKAAQLGALGIRPLVVDWYQTSQWPLLPEIDGVAVCVSHAAIEGLDPKMTHVLGLQNLRANLPPTCSKVVYVSTTGVYAFSDDGRWVDETSPVAPTRPGSLAALEAEKWLANNLKLQQLVILRAAGIYGPERIPSIENLRQQKPLTSDPGSYLNLIHVQDLAEIVIQALLHSEAQGCFTVSDGHPVLRREYYAFIADTLRTPSPIFASELAEPSHILEASAKPRARSEGSKRISNHRLQEIFNYTYQFPTYRHGLLDALRDQIAESHSCGGDRLM